MPREDLSIQLTSVIRLYSEDVRENIRSGLTSVATAAVMKVKAASPKDTGKYRRGWKLDISEKNGEMSFVVHQGKARAGLTHLLEDGHRTRTKKKWVKAQPHIRAVEAWAETESMKAIEKAVKG